MLLNVGCIVLWLSHTCPQVVKLISIAFRVLDGSASGQGTRYIALSPDVSYLRNSFLCVVPAAAIVAPRVVDFFLLEVRLLHFCRLLLIVFCSVRCISLGVRTQRNAKKDETDPS